MERFVSTFTNKIDAKGRVSIPASYRAVLAADPYPGSDGAGIYCYPALNARAVDAGGERLARKISALLDNLPEYSDEREELSVALLSDAHVVTIDGDGRIILPPGLRERAGIDTEVAFVGLGDKFQIWSPQAFEEYRQKVREKVSDNRKFFRPGGAGGEG